jgi:hypothetical protein
MHETEGLVSVQHCTRLYTWSGATLVTFSANLEDAASAPGMKESSASRFTWNALPHV